MLSKARLITPLLVLCALLGACEDKGRLAQQKASAAVERLPPLVERDVGQVRGGLPKGAEELGKRLGDDPGADPAGLQRAIQAARAAVKDLAFAKSTFFLFVDSSGTVLRSEEDPDLPAGKSLTQAIPAMKKLSEPGAGLLEAWGYMEGLRGVNKGADHQWVVGHPVKGKEGKLLGGFVTGWSLRKYAYYLEEDARAELIRKLGEEQKAKAIALTYVFVVKGGQAYGAPVTPDVNAEAVTKLDLAAKVKAGPFRTTLEIEGRSFALEARACKPLGDDAALAVLLSEL
ncbi:MAG: hypothetical protein HY744_02420 [Deltaproteobacteria bacterium]|nr:hypothetical protein [Deltaproteobacteria bacterium]